MDPRWNELVVVLTGAASGIGRATALELANRGATVVAVARRQAALEELADAADGLTGRIEVRPFDVADGDALRSLADDVVQRHGRIDVWINNAAVNLFGAFETPALQDIHRVLDVNLGGVVNGCHAALPHLREQGRGTLVNVSSVLGRIPSPYQAAYVASKHAIHGLTGAIRQELVDTDICVCEIEPGPVDTPMFATAGNLMGRKPVPLEPIYSPERIAAAVLATIRRPRPVRVVGLPNASLVLLARLSPRLVERVFSRLVPRDHFTDEPAWATTGNLYEPARDDATTSGGWRERPSGRRHHLEVAGTASLLLTGFALAASRLRAER